MQGQLAIDVPCLAEVDTSVAESGRALGGPLRAVVASTIIRIPLLFNSDIFLFAFLPSVLIGWWVVFRTPRTRLGFLAVMSYIFYAYYDFPIGMYLLPLLWGSTTVDYIAGNWIHRSIDERQRKRVLVGALAINLSTLGVFKYLGFFEGTVNGVMGLFGHPTSVPVTHILLPIGISFYTFNSMSYTIDIYRRRVEPARNALEYAAFVALFPHLIAGPIVRYSDIEVQLRSLKTRLTASMASVGVYFFAAGLFKKLVIADSIAPTVNRLYEHAPQLSFVSGWAAALGYTMQLYFDFSAYSDMAVGLAMLLGFHFPQNFDSPYKAINISDFWRRWHMTLSRWLRDYLYITLGGSRKGKIFTLRNLFITMFLGGLWHGANWVFVVWGMGHGVLLVLHSIARDRGWTPHSAVLSRALTFLAVVVLWVPFRAGSSPHSMHVAREVLASMVGAHGLGLTNIGGQVGVDVPLSFGLLVVLLLGWVNLAPNTWEVRFRPTRRWGYALGMATAMSCLLLTAPSPFLYFQF